MHAEEVSSIAARPDLAAIAERPDLMARVGYLLEALRGSARGTCPKAQPALFSVASTIMTSLVQHLDWQSVTSIQMISRRARIRCLAAITWPATKTTDYSLL